MLLLEHDEEGSAGLVLNQPSELTLAEAMTAERLALNNTDPPFIFVGGPVQPESAVVLARARDLSAFDEDRRVVGDVGVLALSGDPVATLAEAPAFRVFAGYSGWGPGQLADEIEAGSWFVVKGEADDVFAAELDSLWERVLRRQGGLLSTATDNPELN